MVSIDPHFVTATQDIPPETTMTNFGRVQLGISLDQVNKVLGEPFDGAKSNTNLVLEGEWVRKKSWIGKNGQVLILYTPKQGVIQKTWLGEDGTRIRIPASLAPAGS
jgi:hypothetical protein